MLLYEDAHACRNVRQVPLGKLNFVRWSEAVLPSSCRCQEDQLHILLIALQPEERSQYNNTSASLTRLGGEHESWAHR